MEEKKISKKIIISICSVLLLLVVIFGATFAYFASISSGETREIKVGKLVLGFTDGQIIKAKNINPIKPSDVLELATRKTFSVSKSTNKKDIYAKILIGDIKMSEDLAKYDLKWALYKGSEEDITNGTVEKISTGDFGGKTSGEIVIATNQLINSTTPVMYHLYIWINDTRLIQNSMMNQSLSAKVIVQGEIDKANTLSNVLLSEGVSTTTATFTTKSTDRGLFMQSGDLSKSEMGFPTYYFKGSTTNDTIKPEYKMNNYVKFGTYQTTDGGNTVGDDILWRVVRINEDGSIKLMSENVISSKIAWNNNSVTDYINKDGSDSNIKTVVETWYNNNIRYNVVLDRKVVQSSFCSDVSNNYSTAATRIKTATPNPTFVCPPGSINVYSKVGLLTADEMVYSGGIYETAVENNTSYLGTSSDYYWLITPYNSTNPFYWSGHETTKEINIIYDAKLSYVGAARAVINLRPDVVVTDGDGSSEFPYKIK